ncbi:MAG: PASTA domain-containing protein [Vulcanimicrobiota bacterium]
MVKKIMVKTLKILLLIFLVGFTLAFSFWFGQKIYAVFWELPPEVEVPGLVGEDANVADNSLKEKELTLRIVDSQYNDDFPSNTIIEQNPVPGIMVRKGREISVVVSLGPELTDVPNLKGLSMRDSEVLLGNNRLKVGNVTEVKKGRHEPGEVLEQNPWPGKKVKVGSKVNVMVNEGDDPMIKVPNLVSKNIKDIEKALHKESLKMGTVIWVWQDYVSKGEVIRQLPNPGSMVQPRTPIDVVVSAGQKGFELNLKQKELVFFAPKGEGLQTIKVKQVDNLGDKVIYEGKHAPGAKVVLVTHCWGDAEIQLFYNTRLVRRIKF